MDIEKLNDERKKRGLSIESLANLANLPKSTIEKILFGVVKNPRLDTVQAIEHALGINVDWGKSTNDAYNIYPVGTLLVFEELGSVRAGYDGIINEIPSGNKIEIPASMIKGGNKEDYFVLRVSGNSMYPRLLDGDTILCLRCTSVDSGDLAVILYNGDEATVKKVNYINGQNWLELIPINPEFPTKRLEGVDLEQCRVLGKVVKLIRDL
ncbi:MAG: XRE family transcriptional regulator [Clostridia bacterium]|nr:XRE family transcriptional regulator [Clostridia bacterium]